MNAGRITLAALLGAAAGLFISGYWLMDFFPAGSRQLLLLTVVCAIAAAAGYYRIAGEIQRRLAELRFREAALAVAGSAILGGFLFFGGTSQWQSSDRYISFLLPARHFQLVGVEAARGTRLVWLNTSLGDISYDSLLAKGWSRRGDEMVLEDPAANALEWSGVTGASLEMVFENDQPGGQVELSWDEVVHDIPLNARKTSYEKSFAIPFVASRTFVIALGLLSFVVLALAVLLAVRRRFPEVIQNSVDAGRDQIVPLKASGEFLILGLAMLLAALLRSFRLESVFPAVDEYYHLIAAEQILHGAPLASVYERGLWIVTLPVAFALRIFGHHLWAARAMGVLFNVLALVPLYLVTRKISRPAAGVACLLYAASPWIITFGRVAREYAYYPFYFYWILFAMVSLLDSIPPGFSVRTQWRALLQPKLILLGLVLVAVPYFALITDWLSTFRTILIAYLVLGAFLLSRFEWRERSNWPWLAAAGAILALVARSFYLEQASKLMPIPRLNPVPLGYFFPNPPQQWYFERLAVVICLAVAVTIIASVLLRRIKFVPLFFVGLWLSYIAVFALFSRSFFHTRHLMSTQLWYVVVAAMGLYWLWEMLREVVPWKNVLASAAVGLVIAAAILNPSQILLPTVSSDPDMPISEDYMHDMSAVQAYLVGRVQAEDALISTVYGLYATWEGEPRFAAQHRISSLSTKEEIESIVNQYPSGWIVIDEIRLDLSPFSVRDISELPQIEYIGVFGDEHVWRWE